MSGAFRECDRCGNINAEADLKQCLECGKHLCPACWDPADLAPCCPRCPSTSHTTERCGPSVVPVPSIKDKPKVSVKHRAAAIGVVFAASVCFCVGDGFVPQAVVLCGIVLGFVIYGQVVEWGTQSDLLREHREEHHEIEKTIMELAESTVKHINKRLDGDDDKARRRYRSRC